MFFQPLGDLTATDIDRCVDTAYPLTTTLDSAFTQVMNLVMNGDKCLYCTCRKSPDWKDVAVFALALSAETLAERRTQKNPVTWVRLPIPDNACVWAVSPCGRHLLLNWDHKNPSGYSNEAPALWTVPSDDTGQRPQRLAASFDGYFLGTHWTASHGIVVRYIEGTRIRAAIIGNDDAPLTVNTGNGSVLGMDVSPGGILTTFIAAPDAQPKLAMIDLDKPGLQMSRIPLTHLPQCLSFAAADDERVQKWAWGRQEVVRWESDRGVMIEGVLYLPEGFSANVLVVW